MDIQKWSLLLLYESREREREGEGERASCEETFKFRCLPSDFVWFCDPFTCVSCQALQLQLYFLLPFYPSRLLY